MVGCATCARIKYTRCPFSLCKLCPHPGFAARRLPRTVVLFAFASAPMAEGEGAAGAALQGHQALYGRMSLVERYGEQNYINRLITIRSVYAKPGKHVVPWFNKHGGKNILRHPRNQRKQSTVSRRLIASIRLRGWCLGMRASPCLQENCEPDGPLLAVGAGGMCEASYYCFEHYPDNEMVKATLEQGLQDCEIYFATMPLETVDWLVWLHNQFHKGSVHSFQQRLHDACTIDVEWHIYKKSHHITARGGHGESSYEAAYWKWIQANYDGRMKNYDQYVDCKAFGHTLKRFDLWDKFHEFCSDFCDFMREGFDQDYAIMALQKISVKIISNFAKTDFPKEDIATVLFEALKFAIAIDVLGDDDASAAASTSGSSTSQRLNIPWVFVSSKDSSKVDLLGTSLEGSALCSFESKKKKKKQDKSQGAEQEDFQTLVKLSNGGSRVRTFLDDLIMMSQHVLAQTSQIPKTHPRRQRAFGVAVSIALEFAFLGEVNIAVSIGASRAIKTWTGLRGLLQARMVRSITGVGEDLSSAHIQEELRALLPAEAEVGHRDDEKQGTVFGSDIDNTSVKELAEFLTELRKIKQRPACLHPVVVSVGQDIFESCECDKGATKDCLLHHPTANRILEFIYDKLSQRIKPDWIELGVDVAEKTADTSTLPTNCPFENAVEVTYFLSLRVDYALEMLRLVPSRIPSFPPLEKLTAARDLLHGLDVLLPDCTTWVAAYKHVAEKLCAGELSPDTGTLEIIAQIVKRLNIQPRKKGSFVAVKAEVVPEACRTTDGSTAQMVLPSSAGSTLTVAAIMSFYDASGPLASIIKDHADASKVTTVESVNVMFFKMLEQKAQCSIYSHAFKEQRHNSVHVDWSAKPPTLSCVGTEQEMRSMKLYLFGPVCVGRAGKSKTLQVGSAFDIPIYMQGQSVATLSADCFCPTFMVPIADEAESTCDLSYDAIYLKLVDSVFIETDAEEGAFAFRAYCLKLKGPSEQGNDDVPKDVLLSWSGNIKTPTAKAKSKCAGKRSAAKSPQGEGVCTALVSLASMGFEGYLQARARESTSEASPGTGAGRSRARPSNSGAAEHKHLLK